MGVNRFLFLLLLCGLFASCNHEYQINGHSSINQMDGYMLYVRSLQNSGWVDIDSAEIVHGNFAMNGKTDSVAMTMLFIGEKPIMPLVLERGTINVSISDVNVEARGTKLNDDLYDFMQKQNDIDEQITELQREESRMIMQGKDQEEIYNHLNDKLEHLIDDMNSYVRDFIDRHSDDILGPSVFMMLCSSMPYPMITPEIRDILAEVPTTFKEHWMVKRFIHEAEENQHLLDEERKNGELEEFTMPSKDETQMIQAEMSIDKN